MRSFIQSSVLLQPGARLPSVTRHLLENVWSPARYESLSHSDYLRQGEKEVAHLEECLTLGAAHVWDEIVAASVAAPSLRQWFGLDQTLPPAMPRAAVVFDGLSLRELPLLLKLATESGFRVANSKVIATVLPTETTEFVRDRLLGSALAPAALPGRADLRERGLEVFYLSQANSREHFPSGRNILVWSSYPDRLYSDDAARSDVLFTQFHDLIPTIWKYAVQALPADLPVLLTSDHGYQFFGSGMESTRNSTAPELLGQARNKVFSQEEVMPKPHPDLQVIHSRRLALLRGRVRSRSKGSSARKLYQHGGISLMECLVPWVELHRP